MSAPLQPDVYVRTSRPDLAPGRRRRFDRPAFSVCIVAALGLFAADRLHLPFVERVRGPIQDASSVVLDGLSAATSPVFHFGREVGDWRSLEAANKRLAAENEQLKGWQTRAEALEQRAQALASLAHAAAEQPVGYVTAHVVADAGGGFVRAAILDVGRDQGVLNGYPAMSAEGVVGRVIEASRRSARLLLVTDVNSRIPVAIGATGVRALMMGDNSALPKLAYLPPGSRISPGDTIVTSGVGGVFPAGLRIGNVVDTGDELRAEPATDLDHVTYVSVLLVGTPGAAVHDLEQSTDAHGTLAQRLKTVLPDGSEPGAAK